MASHFRHSQLFGLGEVWIEKGAETRGLYGHCQALVSTYGSKSSRTVRGAIASVDIKSISSSCKIEASL